MCTDDWAMQDEDNLRLKLNSIFKLKTSNLLSLYAKCAIHRIKKQQYFFKFAIEF